MRLALLSALLLVLTLPVRADDKEETRKKVKSLIEESIGGQDWQKRQKLVVSLRKAPQVIEVWLEETVDRPDLADKAWQLSSAAQLIFEARRAEALEPLKKLMKDESADKARYAIQLIEQAGLVSRLAEELIAAFKRQSDGVGSQAMMVLGPCRDPRVTGLLIEEAGKKGDAGDSAVVALANTDSAEARSFLRKVAADEKADQNRRSTALNGLSRNPEPADVELAIGVLKAKGDNLLATALGLLTQARVVVPVDLLKAVKQPDNAYLNDYVDKLLSLAGDVDAAKACLRRAKGGQPYEKPDWYAWAGRSGIKSLKADLEKAFGEETDDNVRMGVLIAIGEMGDPSSIDLIVKYLTHPEQGYQAAQALSALARRTPESLDAILDKLVELTGVAPSGIDSFHYNYLQQPSAEDRVRLIDAYIRLLERVQDRPRIRGFVTSALADMTRPDFGLSEEAVGKWRTWWAANREAWVKGPPKGR